MASLTLRSWYPRSWGRLAHLLPPASEIYPSFPGDYPCFVSVAYSPPASIASSSIRVRLLFWNSRHEEFTIAQCSPTLARSSRPTQIANDYCATLIEDRLMTERELSHVTPTQETMYAFFPNNSTVFSPLPSCPLFRLPCAVGVCTRVLKNKTKIVRF